MDFLHREMFTSLHQLTHNQDTNYLLLHFVLQPSLPWPQAYCDPTCTQRTTIITPQINNLAIDTIYDLATLGLVSQSLRHYYITNYGSPHYNFLHLAN